MALSLFFIPDFLYQALVFRFIPDLSLFVIFLLSFMTGSFCAYIYTFVGTLIVPNITKSSSVALILVLIFLSAVQGFYNLEQDYPEYLIAAKNMRIFATVLMSIYFIIGFNKLGFMDIYLRVLNSRLVELAIKYEVLSYLPFYFRSVVIMFLYNIALVFLPWYLIYKFFVFFTGIQ